MTIHTGITLITIPPALWQTDGNSPWPALLEAEAMHGRRLAKGVELRDVRTTLLDVIRRVAAASSTIPNQDRWTVPSEVLPTWHWLLSHLARLRRLSAARQTGRQHVPAFLPCLFAPQGAASIPAGAYGSLSVADHVTELTEFPLTSTEGAPEEAARVLAERRARFTVALEQQAGLVEWIVLEP